MNRLFSEGQEHEIVSIYRADLAKKYAAFSIDRPNHQRMHDLLCGFEPSLVLFDDAVKGTEQHTAFQIGEKHEVIDVGVDGRGDQFEESDLSAIDLLDARIFPLGGWVGLA